jgi:Tfp pilus assembly protein PilV
VGFTLIETMVAISLLTVAIIAPMSLTMQSLASAYYARDQVTAFYLAQEAIEAVRSVRDGNVLQNSQGTSVNLLNGIPAGGSAFTVDTRANPVTMTLCPGGVCPPLQTDGTFYGYGGGSSGWTNTQFTRTVTATFVTGTTDEIRVSVTVSWKTGSYQSRSFTISENLYRWINDGSGAS